MTISVVQWTTGNVGKESVKAIVANPGLELVGCYAWSDSKVGIDVGELVGIDPIGVAATNDIDALLALAPDVVVYNPMWLSVDELVRILEAGIDVVTTAAFITGGRLGDDRQRLADACERGGSSLFGTGVSPGFAELVAITIAGICSRVDKVTVTETADTTFYDSPDTERVAGFGHPIDHPGPARDGQGGHGGVRRGGGDGRRRARRRARRDRLRVGVRADDRRPRDGIVDDPRRPRRRGGRQLAGSRRRPHGRRPQRPLEEGCHPRARLGHREGRVGDPRRRPADRHSSLDFLPPPDFQAETIEEFMAIGHIITAVPALNAIPAVVAAPPGIVTYADMDFPMPRGWVRR